MSGGEEHTPAGAEVTPGEPGQRRPPPAERLAEIRILTPISIVVPTYEERENLPHLVERLRELKDDHGLELQVLIMDDDSRDGSRAWVEKEAPDWVEIHVRSSNRGLSPSVVDGLKLAKHPVLVVMDADLSHPPDRIPDMILALQAGQQLVIGSRYVPGGSTDDDWGFFRWLNSQVATWLARPFTKVKDPMAGFFALRKADFESAKELNPIGYKIGLELIVKADLENVGEVPIHFSDRVHGESKLTLKEQLNYLVHLNRLYLFKFGVWSSFVQFALVGLSGVFVNLGVLSLMLYLGFGARVSVAGGIVVSILSNFFLNRETAFRYARHEAMGRQLVGFIIAASVGGAVQFAVATAILARYPSFVPQMAALFGIAAGMVINFTMNRFIVFKVKHPAVPEDPSKRR